MLKTIKLLFLLTCWTLSLYIPTTAEAARISFIRDAEIENTIALFAKPVFEAAGLSPEGVEIYLVNDRRLNAFVAGGQKLFINTGLLQRARTPEQVIGVIAHETGHIAGGHLARIKQKLQGISPESIIGLVLGGVAAAAGAPDAAAGIVLGGQSASQRSILAYSRGEEGSADQAAVKYLDKLGISSKGLLQFFEILKREELVTTSQQNPYIRSHPLTAERVSFLKDYVSKSKFADVRVSPEFYALHNRTRAKLDAYLLDPLHTYRLYPQNDQSLPARYARSVAYHKDTQEEKALAEIDSLIAEFPNDPFFHEQKGQILFENGRLKDASVSYEEANRLLPNHPLIQLALGRTYLELDGENLPQAISMLEKVVYHDPTYAFAWRQLGIAYGKFGDTGRSSLALAEEAYLRRQYQEAIYLAGRGEKEFKTGSREWLQAQDLRITSERLLKKQRNR